MREAWLGTALLLQSDRHRRVAASGWEIAMVTKNYIPQPYNITLQHPLDVSALVRISFMKHLEQLVILHFNG
jgi:hypothetical protein